MMIGAQAKDIPQYVRTVVRCSKRLNVVPLCVPRAVGQDERISANLAFVAV